jgi:TetR/AcrR family transcriptional regulator
VKPDARTRILDAALAEFVDRGFEAASSNTIARRARVAKGLVFHHFGTKADLYLVVADRVTARLVDEMFEIFEREPLPTDLFERLLALAIQKVRAFQRDPLGYQLLVDTVDAPAALQARLAASREAYRAAALPRVLDGLDASRLRPGVTLAQAMETLTIFGLGLERTIVAQLAELPDRGLSRIAQITEEVRVHFERLRDGLYVAPRPGPARRARSRRA